MSSILQQILTTKRRQIAEAKQLLSLQELKDHTALHSERRDFIGALRRKHLDKQSAVIAEIKKASPSKGIIREDFNPVEIAKSYAQHGAACLSVLTDQEYFCGAPQNLQLVRDVCELPLLRKDFILDPYQVYESVALGADCILLIVAALTSEEIKNLACLAKSLNLAVLVEVHNEQELEIALSIDTPLIGVNNRDLNTFKVDLNTSIRLLPKLSSSHVMVSESGISTSADVEFLLKNGIYTFLVGEAFMRERSPGEALENLFFNG